MPTAHEIWQKFIALPGSSVEGRVGIASQNAIGGLLHTLDRRNPLRILEIGAGIGTLTFTILNWARSSGMERNPTHALITVENNDYCLRQLAANLKGFEGAYRLVSSVEEARQTGLQFDLITVDGGGDVPNDMGVMPFDHLLQPKGAIFVEGARFTQREKIQEWYGNRPHTYVKMASTQPWVTSASGEIKAKNKPYHLFIYEPSAQEAFSYRAGALWNNFTVRLARRITTQPEKFGKVI